MSDHEELLQRRLEELENGASPRQAAKGLSGEDADLESLIFLAAALKEMPHPKLAPETSRNMQKELIQTARGILNLPMRKKLPSLAWWRSPGFAGLTLAILIIGIIFFGGRVWMAGPSSARTAILTVSSGQVQVADHPQATWVEVEAETKLHSGQLIRTLSNASTTLKFFDGTQVVLEPNTELILNEISGSWGNVLRVKLTQPYGFTSHTVVPFGGKKSSYIVSTPAGSAHVRGTAFGVAVDPRGKAYFVVESGQVLVQNRRSDALLGAGLSTVVLPDQAPRSPAFTFTLNDILTTAEGGTWKVESMPLLITEDAFLAEGLRPGILVSVTGRILQDGRWVVDIVRPAKDSSRKFAFSGVVEEMGGQIWRIGGVTLQIDLATRLSAEIQVGDVVEVRYAVLGSGLWRALAITSIGEMVLPQGTSTLAPSPPGGLATEEPTSPLVSPIVDCTGAEPQPEAVNLAERYSVLPSEIMGWFCQGFGFGEIDQAYSLRDEGYDVSDVFELRSSGQSWGEIKKSLIPKPIERNRPAQTVVPASEKKPTKEPKPTKTPKK